VLAMDSSNSDDLQRMCPQALQNKIRRLLEFSAQTTTLDVPDPYYGGVQGFERVLDLIESGARGLLEDIRPKVKA